MAPQETIGTPPGCAKESYDPSSWVSPTCSCSAPEPDRLNAHKMLLILHASKHRNTHKVEVWLSHISSTFLRAWTTKQVTPLSLYPSGSTRRYHTDFELQKLLKFSTRTRAIFFSLRFRSRAASLHSGCRRTLVIFRSSISCKMPAVLPSARTTMFCAPSRSITSPATSLIAKYKEVQDGK